jgi:hypothetical protein
MNTCINCGNPTDNKGFFAICDNCQTASNNMVNLLNNGLTLGYSDGSSETICLADENCPELEGDGGNYDF